MIERGGRHWEGSAMALPAWEDCACDKKNHWKGSADLRVIPVVQHSLSSRRSEGGWFHQRMCTQAPVSSRRHTNLHYRYCDSRAYHLVIQLSLE